MADAETTDTKTADEYAEMFREAFRRLGYPNLPTKPPDMPGEERNRLAEEIFERDVKPHVKDRNEMDYVAIDLESRTWTVGQDEDVALNELRHKCPDARNVIFQRVRPRAFPRLGHRRPVR